ncbi:MAG: CoA transferase, partial [Acidimicrobiales bacterium]|nr:CoA transferase [Acidimicrobiales bacterium]
LSHSGRPLAGVKVLDLTRVIAGPVCTRFLAAHGATVLRIDPPGFDEVGALLPETTAGKRAAWLDLSTTAGRNRFLSLVGEADVLVHGLRPGALERHGLGPDEVREANPAMVTARLDAYGWRGPWAARRGFDSLVQMSCGIAAAGMAATGADRPTPLPAQALDHGAGHLLAAAVARALASGRAADVTASLVGVANLLIGLPDPAGIGAGEPRWSDEDREQRATEWGPAMVAPMPGELAGWPMSLDAPAGPLGRHAPTFGA